MCTVRHSIAYASPSRANIPLQMLLFWVCSKKLGILKSMNDVNYILKCRYIFISWTKKLIEIKSVLYYCDWCFEDINKLGLTATQQTPSCSYCHWSVIPANPNADFDRFILPSKHLTKKPNLFNQVDDDNIGIFIPSNSLGPDIALNDNLVM